MSCFSRFLYVLLGVMYVWCHGWCNQASPWSIKGRLPLSCKSSLERNKIFFYISLFSLTFNIESCSESWVLLSSSESSPSESKPLSLFSSIPFFYVCQPSLPQSFYWFYINQPYTPPTSGIRAIELLPSLSKVCLVCSVDCRLCADLSTTEH